MRPPKKARPTRHGVAFWIEDKDGRVLLRRRPEQGLLGGMMEIPSTDWRDTTWTDAEAQIAAPTDAGPWSAAPGEVRHTFTHFYLRLRVLVGRSGRANKNLGTWVYPDDFDSLALPTAMKKVAGAVLGR